MSINSWTCSKCGVNNIGGICLKCNHNPAVDLSPPFDNLADQLARPLEAIIADGEPYFILRAKDPLALAALMVWIEKAEKFGATEEAVKAAWAIVADFQRWQQKNGTEVP